MKKIFIYLFLLFLMTGCSKVEMITCDTVLYNEIEEYKLKAKYNIYHENNFVTKIEKEEIYESEKDSTLEFFEVSKELEYKNLRDLYGGTIYLVKNKKDKIVINVVMDLNELNIKQMVKDKYIDKDYVVAGKLTTGGIKKIYESKGAICK